MMDGSTASLFWDFLSFRVLMTPAILVVVYYFGAIAGPLAVIIFLKKAGQVSGLSSPATPRRGQLRESINESKSLLILAGVILLIILEVFWRMLFEFLIAYFQIHNALMGMG